MNEIKSHFEAAITLLLGFPWSAYREVEKRLIPKIPIDSFSNFECWYTTGLTFGKKETLGKKSRAMSHDDNFFDPELFELALLEITVLFTHTEKLKFL